MHIHQRLSACGRLLLATTALALSLSWLSLTFAAEPPKQLPIDHVVPVWYMGMPAMGHSFEYPEVFLEEAKLPKEADFPWHQTLSYIVGMADKSIGVSPHQRISPPGAPPMIMPGHQAVVTCLNTPEAPTLGIAYAVLPGPKASKHNVRSDAMPEHSIIGAPLANAIRIGPTWLPLTNHRVIEWGLHKDLLRLRFFGASPIGWYTPDWDNNYPTMPEMNEPCNAPSRPNPKFVLPADPSRIIPQH